MKRGVKLLAILTLTFLLFTGCNGLVSTSSTLPTASSEMGTIQVRVTDAPPQFGVQEVWITFTGVEVHKAGTGPEDNGGRIPLTITGESLMPDPPDKTFPLVALKEAGIVELLAEEDIVSGNYTQLRVEVSEVWVDYYELDENGNPILDENEDPILHHEPAELPSGTLKFVRPFEVINGGITTLILDVDADNSVNFTGAFKDGVPKIIVKPVVKLEVQHGDATPPAQVENLVVDDSTPGRLDLSWDEITAPDFDHYLVYRSGTSGGLPDEGWPKEVDKDTTIYTDDEVTPEVEYFYIVTAVDESGNEGLPSNEVSRTPSEPSP